MDTEFVWLQHPDIAAENPDNPDAGKARFAASVADVWQQRGWKPCEPPTEVNPALTPQPPAEEPPTAPPAAPAPVAPEATPTVSGGTSAPGTTSRRPAGVTAEEA